MVSLLILLHSICFRAQMISFFSLLNDEWVISVMFRNGEQGGKRFNNWIRWLTPAGSVHGVWHCRIQGRLAHMQGTYFALTSCISQKLFKSFSRNSLPYKYYSVVYKTNLPRNSKCYVAVASALYIYHASRRDTARGSSKKERLVHMLQPVSSMNEHAVADNSVLHVPCTARTVHSHIEYSKLRASGTPSAS